MSCEEYLKERICSNCHITILDPHPEEKFQHKYLKCKLCGFTKEYERIKTEAQIKNNKIS